MFRKRRSRGLVLVIILLSTLSSLTGCATYVTPGRGVMLSTLADADIQELMSRKPASPFPARLAVARIQAPNYRSFSNEGFGNGRYTVVTTRDIEQEKHFERMGRLPMILAVAPINRIILPSKLETDKELRISAAKLQADLLLIYTIDTSFRIRGIDIGPLAVITLGFLPTQEATVTATASAVIYDVRTGFVYGLAESTARESQMASVWTTQSAIEQSRLNAETKAFDQLLDELDKTWRGVLKQQVTRPTGKTGDGT